MIVELIKDETEDLIQELDVDVIPRAGEILFFDVGSHQSMNYRDVAVSHHYFTRLIGDGIKEPKTTQSKVICIVSAVKSGG